MKTVKLPDNAARPSCNRKTGRAPLALKTKLETTGGQVRCMVTDLSPGGAKVESERAIEADADLWLVLRNLTVFANVRWTSGTTMGLEFEEKLPKALILSLRGESVDAAELEAAEAMLAARDWVVGAPNAVPTSVRIANVLGSRGTGSGSTIQSQAANDVGAPGAAQKLKRQAITLALGSALFGALVGVASSLLF